MYPAPGLATEQDLIDAHRRDGRLCELIDGVLVEKTVGYYESVLALMIATTIREFLDQHDLGVVSGADSTLRLFPGQVREPDVAFVGWHRFPNRRLPREPIPTLAPDLAVEVLSKGNTAREMDRKLQDYFGAGVKLVWYIEPDLRTVTVYSSISQAITLTEKDILDGGEVLPGFSLSIRELFSRVGQRE